MKALLFPSLALAAGLTLANSFAQAEEASMVTDPVTGFTLPIHAIDMFDLGDMDRATVQTQVQARADARLEGERVRAMNRARSMDQTRIMDQAQTRSRLRAMDQVQLMQRAHVGLGRGGAHH